VETKGSHDPPRTLILILHYLVQHPDAVDTVEGIVTWWLPKDTRSRGNESVKTALDTLVSTGWLTERKLGSSKLLYGLNKQCLNEVREFLKRSEMRDAAP
jgi:hypothetical protein